MMGFHLMTRSPCQFRKPGLAVPIQAKVDEMQMGEVAGAVVSVGINIDGSVVVVEDDRK